MRIVDSLGGRVVIHSPPGEDGNDLDIRATVHMGRVTEMTIAGDVTGKALRGISPTLFLDFALPPSSDEEEPPVDEDAVAAWVYRRAYRAGAEPRAAVMEWFEASPSGADRRIARARKLGMLAPAAAFPRRTGSKR